MENLMNKDVLQSITNIAAKAAVDAYVNEQLKNTIVGTKEASLFLGCSIPTLLGYIRKGYKEAGKLPANSTGHHFKIIQYDLVQFRDKMKF